RRQRPLFCIDLAVPRDIDPEVNHLDDVYLYDIDSLQAIADQSLEERRGELVVCEALIQKHVQDFRAWIDAEAKRANQGLPEFQRRSEDSPAHGV
ncbi:MAG: glutamyl-tRNA reductase, partial [Proteobacteria bacterium]|nr:glutamyl-tRNA reductase [Pseudomonadota bacterium]